MTQETENKEFLNNSKESRNSTLEILRIVSMIFVVLHHCCLHGESYLYGAENVRAISIFFIPLGKIFYCVFVIISCWFLIEVKFKSKRFLKIWLTTFIYNILFLVIGLLLPSYDISIASVIKSFFPIFGFGITHGFISGFLLFMLILPCIKFVYSILKYKAVFFITVFIFLLNMYTLYLGNMYLVDELLAFIEIFNIVYLVKQFYKVYDLKKYSLLFLLLFIIFVCISEAITYVNITKVNVIVSIIRKYLCFDERCLLNILAALSIFLFVYSLPAFKSKVINFISGFTLDVLLIHDSGLLRRFIWDDLFCSSKYYSGNQFFLWLFLCAIIILVAGFICYTIRYFISIILNKIYDFNTIYKNIDNYCMSLKYSKKQIESEDKK